MYGYIYLIEDTINGKKYVGQHKYDKYFQLDNSYHGSGKMIKYIRKFRKETLKECLIMNVETLEEANFFERYFIYKYDTLYPKGYNYTEGGDDNPMLGKGYLISGEKNGMYGKHHTEETKKKLSEKLKGGNRTSFKKGQKRSEESIRKQSETQRNNKFSKSVLQFTKNGEFVAEYPSINEVERQIGYNHSFICRVLKGKTKSAYGYLWRYK